MPAKEKLVITERTALFDPLEIYRYRLGRRWRRADLAYIHPHPDGPLLVTFLMLNPSTATHEVDDPTIRRCMRFAHDWGADGCEIVNIFAFRSTDPKRLREVADPVGPENDHHILAACREALAKPAGYVVAAWGANAKLGDRDRRVMALLAEHGIAVHALEVTKEGFPGHPLYIPGDAKPVPYAGRSGPWKIVAT